MGGGDAALLRPDEKERQMSPDRIWRDRTRCILVIPSYVASFCGPSTQVSLGIIGSYYLNGEKYPWFIYLFPTNHDGLRSLTVRRQLVLEQVMGIDNDAVGTTASHWPLITTENQSSAER